MEPKFFLPLDILEAHFRFEFQDPIPKIGAWGDDRRNKKNQDFFNGHISNQFTDETAKRTQILSTACCSAIKYKILVVLTYS